MFDVVVIHSGGMDSSLCLALAVREFGPQQVLSMSFNYGQRHSPELERAKSIANHFGVKNIQFPVDCLSEITDNALINPNIEIKHDPGKAPNTLVVGRNGLMVRIAAIHAQHLGAHYVYTGVIEVEAANSGYRDCSRDYMDKMQEILRIDLDDESFEVRTPVVKMTKRETMELGHELGELEYLLRETITCYEGKPLAGCMECPACKLRNEGIVEFANSHPSFQLPYAVPDLGNLPAQET